MQHALLIVDMQVGLFHGPAQPWQGQRVLGHICQLIAAARAAGAPIFAVRHTGPQGSPIEAGSAPWQLLPELQLDEKQAQLINKTRPSCFAGTGLAEKLAAAGIGGLVICGMKTQYCIDSTCRAAADLGLQVVLVADAHTCMDTAELPASAIVAHHNATLGSLFARLQPTAEITFF